MGCFAIRGIDKEETKNKLNFYSFQPFVENIYSIIQIIKTQKREHYRACLGLRRIEFFKLKMSCSLIGKTPFFGSGLYQFKSGQLS